MNPAEYANLSTIGSTVNAISVGDLHDTKDRTLLYGYTVERHTWHVFLYSREIHRYIYDEEMPDKPVFKLRDHAVTWRQASDLIPSSRAYPEACDYEFCSLLKKKGLFIPFTKFNPRRKPAKFHGLI